VPPLFLPFVGRLGGAFVSVLILLCLALVGVSAKCLRSHQVRARALVLTAVIASAIAWLVAVASPLLCITTGMPVGVEGVAGVTVEAETLMHQNHGAHPAALLGLMDQYVLVELFRGRFMSASIEGITRVAVELEKLVHHNRSVWPSVVKAKELVASRGVDL